MSQTGANTYYVARFSNIPIIDALSKAIEKWRNLEKYVLVHGELGQEIYSISGGKSLISFSTNKEIAQRLGSTILHIKTPRSKVIQKILETSTESEYLIINGVKP